MTWVDMISMPIAAAAAVECVAGRIAPMDPRHHRPAVIAVYALAATVCILAASLVWQGAGLLVLLLGGLNPVASLVFVVLYGLGNGMNTIVKGTAMAQYVSQTHVGQLNGLLGVPIALARAAAPLTLGLLWSPAQGYTLALWWLLTASVLGTAALWMAQNRAMAARR